MSLHTIHFMKPIDPSTLAELQNVTLSALRGNATELCIYISSTGGNNDQGFAAYYLLRSLPIPVITHCIGNIESMAVIMFLAGAKRMIVPHGKIKIHPMFWGFPGGAIDHDRLAEFVASLDFDAKRYADIFDERTKGAKEIVDVRTHLAGRARILDSAAAMNSGIAMEIADAVIPTTAIRWWV